jgi:hypothetical protein
MSKILIRRTLREQGNHPSCCPRRIPTNIHRLVLHPISFSVCADADKWCSLCNDFGETLVLCSTCRVCVYVTGPASTRECLNWDPCTKSPAFIFRCLLWTRKTKSPSVVCTEFASKRSSLMIYIQLSLAVRPPNIKQVHFCYDPAVLVISLVWGETRTCFSTQLYH